MNTDDLVARLEKAVQAILSTKHLSEQARIGCGELLDDLMIEILRSALSPKGLPSLTEGQIKKIRALAIELLVSEEPGFSWDLTQVLALGGAPGYSGPLATTLELKYRPEDGVPEGTERMPLVRASLLEELGVFEPGERPLYYDFGGLYIKSKRSGREGTLYVTNERIIAVGPCIAWGESTLRHFYYADWEERPYLSSLYYVYIDQLMKPKRQRHEVKAKYHTKYWEEKERMLYGPYVFWAQLPSKLRIKEGDVDIYIVPTNFKEGVIVPYGDQERRTGILYDSIMQVRSDLGVDDS